MIRAREGHGENISRFRLESINFFRSQSFKRRIHLGAGIKSLQLFYLAPWYNTVLTHLSVDFVFYRALSFQTAFTVQIEVNDNNFDLIRFDAEIVGGLLRGFGRAISEPSLNAIYVLSFGSIVGDIN